MTSHNGQSRHWWMPFITFFLGTPKRFLITAAALFLAFAFFFPDIVGPVWNTGVAHLTQMVRPLFPLLLMAIILGFAYLAFSKAFKQLHRKPPAKKRRH